MLIALHTGLDEEVVREEFADYDLFMPKVDDTNALLKMVAGVLSKSAAELKADSITAIESVAQPRA